MKSHYYDRFDPLALKVKSHYLKRMTKPKMIKSAEAK